MKTILITLLFSPLFCIGQRFVERKDNVAKTEYSHDCITSSSSESNAIKAFKYGRLAGTPIEGCDTVRVIMLVCDTATQKYRDSEWWNLEGKPQLVKDGIAYYKQPPVFWMYGYIVNDLTIRIIEDWMPDPPPIYLDDKKKPLSKNIIVWQSKEIK